MQKSIGIKEYYTCKFGDYDQPINYTNEFVINVINNDYINNMKFNYTANFPSMENRDFYNSRIFKFFPPMQNSGWYIYIDGNIEIRNSDALSCIFDGHINDKLDFIFIQHPFHRYIIFDIIDNFITKKINFKCFIQSLIMLKKNIFSHATQNSIFAVNVKDNDDFICSIPKFVNELSLFERDQFFAVNFIKASGKKICIINNWKELIRHIKIRPHNNVRKLPLSRILISRLLRKTPFI